MNRAEFIRRGAALGALAWAAGPVKALEAAFKNAADSSGTPVGYIHPWAGGAPPPGWLPCDGRALALRDYPRLYAVIGKLYGGGGGSFRLPDMRVRIATIEQDGRVGSYEGAPNLLIRAA